MERYVAVIHKGQSGSYGVSVPDFPGFVSAGTTYDQALESAANGLRFHVDGMIADGLPIPAPRDVSDLRDDPEYEVDFEGAIVTLLPLLPPRGEPVRLNISLEAGLVVAIDAMAKARGMTRSGFLAEAARRALAG